MFPFFYDWTQVILIPGVLLMLWASMRVKSTFAEYSRIGTRSGITAAQVARAILDQHGMSDIAVEQVPGNLTDHYDPKAKVVRLSGSTYHEQSIAAIGVAAHEVGHAIQHDQAYVPLNMRNMIWPVARIGDSFGPFLVLIGFFFGGNMWLINIGIWLFMAAVGFYLVTLPVEYNASSRAVEILESGGYMTRDEVAGAKKVLNAAALTYVASAASAILGLARLLLLRNMANRDD